MKQHDDDRKTTGPSWWDVREHQAELRKAWGGSCVIEMTAATPGPGGMTYALWVRVVHRARADGKWGAETAKASPWPHTDHKTMPGLLLKLIWELDWELVAKRDEAARQAAF